MSKNCIEIDIKVPNHTRYLSLVGRIGEDIASELLKHRGEREDLADLAFHLNIVLTEAVVNAIKYAGPADADKAVHVCINISDEELWVRVFDYGQGFDIDAVPPPDFDNLEDQGRGIFIIKYLMDSVSYRKVDNGNVLEMLKKLK
jgi:serine/threonine-protein kinase RsbW